MLQQETILLSTAKDSVQFITKSVVYAYIFLNLILLALLYSRTTY